MTDLWTIAGDEAESEDLTRRVVTAKEALASTFAFILGASDRADLSVRRELASDLISKAAAAVSDDDPELLVRVISELDEDIEDEYEMAEEEVLAARKKAWKVSDQQVSGACASGGHSDCKMDHVDRGKCLCADWSHGHSVPSSFKPDAYSELTGACAEGDHGACNQIHEDMNDLCLCPAPEHAFPVYAKLAAETAHDKAAEMLKGATEEQLRLMLQMAVVNGSQGDAESQQVETWIRTEMRARGLEHRATKTADTSFCPNCGSVEGDAAKCAKCDTPMKEARKTASDESYDVDMCVDCVMFAANAELPENNPDDFLEAFNRNNEGYTVVVGDGEGFFSWSSCDVCGSNLGGDRFPGFLLKNSRKLAVSQDAEDWHEYQTGRWELNSGFYSYEIAESEPNNDGGYDYLWTVWDAGRSVAEGTAKTFEDAAKAIYDWLPVNAGQGQFSFAKKVEFTASKTAATWDTMEPGEFDLYFKEIKRALQEEEDEYTKGELAAELLAMEQFAEEKGGLWQMSVWGSKVGADQGACRECGNEDGVVNGICEHCRGSCPGVDGGCEVCSMFAWALKSVLAIDALNVCNACEWREVTTPNDMGYCDECLKEIGAFIQSRSSKTGSYFLTTWDSAAGAYSGWGPFATEEEAEAKRESLRGYWMGVDSWQIGPKSPADINLERYKNDVRRDRWEQERTEIWSQGTKTAAGTGTYDEGYSAGVSDRESGAKAQEFVAAISNGYSTEWCLGYAAGYQGRVKTAADALGTGIYVIEGRDVLGKTGLRVAEADCATCGDQIYITNDGAQGDIKWRHYSDSRDSEHDAEPVVGTIVEASKTASTRYETAQRVIQNSQAEQLEGHLLDLQTAKVLVAVYEALSPENQAKFDAPDLMKLVDMGWRNVAKKLAKGA